MTKFKLILMAGLLTFAATACGDDDNSDADKDTGKDSSSEDPGADAGDTNDGVTGLAACENFLTTTFDKIKDCETDLAAALPPNSTAGLLCQTYCPEMDGKTVTQEANDACVAFVGDLPCEVLEADPDGGTGGIQIPEECNFLTDDLSCDFPM